MSSPTAPPRPEEQPREPPGPLEITRLRDLSPLQWKSGLAAWVGWLFDGLDMHLFKPKI
jgi:hypothetical protein